jgi:trans-aconitate methyltransferase
VAKQSWDTELYEGQHSFVWKLGEGLLNALRAQPGERILDIGCGTGQLTAAIAETGATVLGLDSSPEMIGQARQNYPRLQFVLEDAAAMRFDAEFDAIFSNAALHWMLDAEAVVVNMSRALKPGGRLIAEFGGKGNILRIQEAIRHVLAGYDPTLADVQSRHYFPSVSEYATLLEKHGLEVQSIALFHRPTPLAGEKGMEQWLRQFAFWEFDPLPVGRKSSAIEQVVDELRPALYNEEGWKADYRRLRVAAVKL